MAERTESEQAESKPVAAMADHSSIRERAEHLGLPTDIAARLDAVIRDILVNEGLVAAQDALFLAQTILGLMEPKFATGRDLFARFGRDGPPSKLAIEPPREEPYVPYRLQR
ncbi:hypothetical protein GGQ99_002334 [Aminobacter niigataensis]|uniref:Uncharacterized protein n=1 Tax=Aminobacter niigataensis TaxID=83265 RepID=A0ABR6L317_9HYPH|nr:hypothetical protein [Aminobacter niigataensis]MBB4650579.1 hypothetical protein [Aminobacter niigataensis]